MPSAAFFDEDDEWYQRDRLVSGARHVTRPQRTTRDDGFNRRSDFLVPESRTTATGLHRTRSQGHAPTPNVTIYNTTRLDNESNPNVRTDQRSPVPSPLASPRGRPLRAAEDLEAELAELRLEVARQRRSRSRSAHHHRDDSPDHGHGHHNHQYDKWQLQQANERLKEAEERIQKEKDDEYLRKQMELKYFKERTGREQEDAKLRTEEERIKKALELKYFKDRTEREEEEARMKKALELKYFKERTEREEEEARFKTEEELIKKRLELKYLKEKAEREEKEAQHKAEEERLKNQWELKMEQEERKKAEQARKADEDRKRIIAENQLRLEESERKAKAERQAAVDEFNKRKAEEERKDQEERERVVAQYERKKLEDAAKAKKQRDELLLQIKIEAEKKKQEEEEEYARFLAKQEKMQKEAEAKKAKEDKIVEDEMRKRLAQFGFQENQIHAMIKPEEAAKLQQGMTPLNPVRLHNPPTYVKVHKDHLSIETLVYYDIPYEVDRSDPDHLIILREMDQRETEILFEHTRRLRSRGSNSNRLLIEAERSDRGKAEYAWVRRRNKSVSRSPSRRRSSPKRVVGLKEMFF